MPELPARPNLEQLRHQAKDLLAAARKGDRAALARVGAVSERVRLAAAQLAVARESGFVSWTKLKREVERREILDDRNPARLMRLLAEDATLATAMMTRPGASGARCPAPARSSVAPGGRSAGRGPAG